MSTLFFWVAPIHQLLLAGLTTISIGQEMAVETSSCPYPETGNLSLGAHSAAELVTEHNWSFEEERSDQQSLCWVAGVGQIPMAPDAIFSFSNVENDLRNLEISASSTCETALLVQDGDGGWHHNQKNDVLGRGLDPNVLHIENAPAGTYRVWIGSQGQESCQMDLRLETTDR